MARRDDGGTFFSARRNPPALERAISDLAPAPWKQTARDTSSARNTDSTIKRFTGDSRLAAALLPLAQTILGGLLSRLALGGIDQGARAVRLSDGSIIRVVTNSGIHVIEIDCRAASAPSARSIVFALHPHSDSAPQGWWFPTEEATARVAMDEVEEEYYYPRHSYYSDEGVDTNFWWDIYHRPHASLTVNPQEQRCTLVMDRDIWFGNQTVYAKSGGAVWSWWHSPHGDAPLYALGGDATYRARHTPYLAGGTLQVVVYYDPGPPTIVATATITPCVFRNSQWVWSYSDDDIGDFDNEITADDSAVIGGVYPVTADRILVVVLTNAARTATLWDVTVHPPDLSTKTSIWTATVGDENTSAMRWPWRFHPDGTECSTIVAYTKDSPAGGGARYTEYKIWTLSISYNEESGTFSASKSESGAYYIRHVGTVTSEASGTLVYPGYGTMTSSGSQDWVVDATHAEIPLACAYNPDGELVVAWLNVAGTTITSSSTGEYSGAAPGDYSDGGSSDSSTTTTAAIIIGGVSYALSAVETTSTSSQSQEVLYSGNASRSSEGESSSSGTNKRVLFLDVLTKTLVLYANNAVSIGSSSMSASWPPGISGPMEATVSGSTTFNGGDYLWYLDDLIFAAPVETEVTASPYNVDYPYINPPTAHSSSHTSYTYIQYPDQSQLSIDMGFGMALDQNGEFFILSYDCLERDVNLGGEITTLARQSGNYSNIPGLAAALTFDGDNKLLFPLGIGVVGSL